MTKTIVVNRSGFAAGLPFEPEVIGFTKRSIQMSFHQLIFFCSFSSFNARRRRSVRVGHEHSQLCTQV